MLPRNIAFVDIETTGLRSPYDRIIEIGIIRVEDDQVVQTYHSLINPEGTIHPEITQLTGITDSDLENAPTFRSIKEDILEALIDCTFVAHNVRFDYGFLKNEFKRENISFSSKQFCTVKLSRALFPTHRRHNLDAIIERFAIECEKRHRALDDAKVIFAFYQHLQKTIAPKKLAATVDRLLKKPSLPTKLHTSFIEKLPEQPGVYIFYDGQNMPLYVGKSINIKNRVLDHFASDIHSPTEMNISQQIERIETITTAGELGALFLESQLIKTLLPIYNKKSRIRRELIALRKVTNEGGYETVQMEVFQQSINNSVIASETKQPLPACRQVIIGDRHVVPLSGTPRDDDILGFFKSRKQAKAYLADIAKKNGLCERLLGLEKTNGACFAYRLGRCKGACIGKEKALVYNLRFIAAFASTKIQPWPFPGPIIIEEHELLVRHEYFAVDNWCVVGHIIIDDEGNKKSNIHEDVTFDVDLYQILKSYLKKPQLLRKVKQITRNELLVHFT